MILNLNVKKKTVFNGHIEPSGIPVFFGGPLRMRVSDGKYKTSINAGKFLPSVIY
jgi:hypothetical protein